MGVVQAFTNHYSLSASMRLRDERLQLMQADRLACIHSFVENVCKRQAGTSVRDPLTYVRRPGCIPSA